MWVDRNGTEMNDEMRTSASQESTPAVAHRGGGRTGAGCSRKAHLSSGRAGRRPRQQHSATQPGTMSPASSLPSNPVTCGRPEQLRLDAMLSYELVRSGVCLQACTDGMSLNVARGEEEEQACADTLDAIPTGAPVECQQGPWLGWHTSFRQGLLSEKVLETRGRGRPSQNSKLRRPPSGGCLRRTTPGSLPTLVRLELSSPFHTSTFHAAPPLHRFASLQSRLMPLRIVQKLSQEQGR